MANLKIELKITVDYSETLTYNGSDVLMAEALVNLIKLNKAGEDS
jgi:hypothetical protein